MFRTTITRPLLWAIPLAVVAVSVAAVYYLRPLRVEVDGHTFACREIMVVDVSDPCDDERWERFLVTVLILGLGGLPLVLVGLRACVLAADALFELRQEVRWLRERLDRDGH